MLTLTGQAQTTDSHLCWMRFPNELRPKKLCWKKKKKTLLETIYGLFSFVLSRNSAFLMLGIRYVILIENTGASANLSHLCKGGKRTLTQRERGLVWVWEDC